MTTLNRNQVDIKAELEECFAELEEMGHQMMVDLGVRLPGTANPYMAIDAKTNLPAMLPIVQEKAKVLAILTELKGIEDSLLRPIDVIPVPKGSAWDIHALVHYSKDSEEMDPVCGIDEDSITMAVDADLVTCFACKNWLVQEGI